MQQRLLDDANLQRRGPRQIAAIAAVREHIGLDFREFNPPNIFPQNGPAPRENINPADYAANPFPRAPAPREGAFVIREAGNRLDEDNFWVHPRNRDPFNNQGQRRCPTCQKHFRNCSEKYLQVIQNLVNFDMKSFLSKFEARNMSSDCTRRFY